MRKRFLLTFEFARFYGRDQECVIISGKFSGNCQPEMEPQAGSEEERLSSLLIQLGVHRGGCIIRVLSLDTFSHILIRRIVSKPYERETLLGYCREVPLMTPLVHLFDLFWPRDLTH
jgi:hypothetical protein